LKEAREETEKEKRGVWHEKKVGMLTGLGLLVPIQSHLLVFSLVVNIAAAVLALFLISKEWKYRRMASVTQAVQIS
jgi:uncharacterized membrane protein